MLRITEYDTHSNGLTLRLEGRLSGPHVDEFIRVCAGLDAERRLELDLGGLSWLDDAGVAAIRALMDRDATVSCCKPFVWHLLRRSNP